ncbi:MAG: hypothetical protein R6V23_11000 [Bacteroidales bacterium]
MKSFSIYKKIIIISSVCFLFVNQNALAQSQKIESGKSAAMSNTSVALTDIWSVYHNQAGLGYIDDITLGIFHQSGFIKQQNMQGIGIAYPTKTGTIAASYSYYGFSQYNEMQAGLAFGRSFTKHFAVGLQINYLSTRIADNYGSANTVNFEVGILSQPVDNFFIGAHVYNPSRSKTGNEIIPTIFKFGAGYLFSDKLYFSIETEKDLEHDAIFKTGLSYQLIEIVSLQAGVSTNPTRYSFGIGFHYININAHVGFLKHQTLGFTPSFTLSYGF